MQFSKHSFPYPTRIHSFLLLLPSLSLIFAAIRFVLLLLFFKKGCFVRYLFLNIFTRFLCPLAEGTGAQDSTHEEMMRRHRPKRPRHFNTVVEHSYVPRIRASSIPVLPPYVRDNGPLYAVLFLPPTPHAREDKCVEV